MNLITIIPLTRSKVAETLSYFTASEVPLGAIVSVPLRSKKIYGIVTDRRRVEDLKVEIKTAPFEIRKAGKIKASAFFSPAFIDSCRILADYYATTVGAVIDTLVADSIMENAHKLSAPLPLQASFIATPPSPDETYAVQGDDEDRMSTWRSLVRQEFARKKSLAIYVPTIEDGRLMFQALEKGIEGYIFFINGSMAKKKIPELWKTISDTDHPVVIIATASFSVLPRADIETVVIERENGRGWISPKSPNIDLRHALETLARRQRQTVYLSDSFLRVETLYRLEQHEIDEGSPFKWRSISTAKDSLIDMRTDKASQANNGKRGFHVLSPELEELIERNREDSTHLFILALRRGLSTMTVCDDCGTIVTCAQCGAPVVLHTSADSPAGPPAGGAKNFFMCHKCGTRRSADEECSVCGGWRLTALGIGIDKVREAIREKFGKQDIFVINTDVTPTFKDIEDTLMKFRAKPGSVLIGTELALLHIADRVEHVAVVSLDSLFALPDFRIQEKILYTLVRLRTTATRSFLVQTRRPDETVFDCGLKGNLSDFYRQTLSERKQFMYPPFSTLIKLTLEGKKDVISHAMAGIQKLFEPHEIDIFPAFTRTLRGNAVIHGLLKMERGRWPDADIVSKLRGLDPSVSIKINPESLL